MIYVLAPVRNVTSDQSLIIASHVQFRQEQGAKVFNPVVDAPQQDETGFNIVKAEVNFLNRMAGNGAVDILWNLGGNPSEGSRVDVGFALAFNLDMNLVTVFNRDQPPVGPQVAYQIVQEVTNNLPHQPYAQKAVDLLVEMSQAEEAVIDWNIAMIGEVEEWQRIRLGLALACFSQNPDFKIKLGNLVGIDPPGKKSYPKVIAEIMGGKTF